MRGYQKDAARKLASGERLGLWVGGGLGKSATIQAALHLRGLHHGPVLYVTRAIGRGVWPRDAKWVLGPDFVPAIVTGGKAQGSRVHESRMGVVSYSDIDLALSRHAGLSINYELLEARYDELIRIPWKAVVYDEAHQLKGGFQRQTKDRDGRPIMRRYDYAKILAQAAHARGAPVWEATATPIRDRRRDLWSQLDIAQPGQWGRSAWGFLHEFCSAFINEWGGLDSTGESNTAELEARLNGIFVRLSRDEVAHELPKLQRDVREIAVTNVANLAGGGIEDAIERSAKLKIPDALDLIADYLIGGCKVVVVVNRRRLAGFVGQAIQQSLEVPRPVREKMTLQVVDGAVEPLKRKAIVDAFNMQSAPGVLVAVTESIGETIDLHMVDAAIALSLPYTPGILEQFEMRFARLGGKACVIHYLVGIGTIDEQVRNVLLDKLEDVMDLGADTQGGDAIRRQLAGLEDEEKVLAHLRSWLAEAG